MTNPLISALKQGLKSSPENLPLLQALADAQISSGLKEEGLTTLQEIIGLDAQNSQALAQIIELAQQLDKADLVSAYQALKSTFDPTSVSPTLPAENSSEDNAEIDKKQRVRGAPLKLVSGNSENTESDDDDFEDPSIYLDDVSGMEEVKHRLRISFLAPLQNPDLVKKYGKSVGGGLILYGPPGCGKTFIARALAGELGAKFISVGLSDILDMYVGESERKLHEIFESARRNNPAVLFVDELDALGQKRSNLKHSGMRTLVNQLLNEMDSVNNNNENLFILGATNHPWDVDEALKRPGRFDRMIAVFPPDKEARESILGYHLKDAPVESIDFGDLARQTPLFSGADLAHLSRSAIDQVFERSLKSGLTETISSEDFVKPLKEIKPSTLSWFDSAKNYAMFSNKNGQYDDILNFIQTNKL